MIRDWTVEALNTSAKWVADNFIKGVHFVGVKIYEYSDVALVIAVTSIIVAMFGSKRASKVTYWTLAIYLIIQMLGMVL